MDCQIKYTTAGTLMDVYTIYIILMLYNASHILTHPHILHVALYLRAYSQSLCPIAFHIKIIL